MAQSFGSRDELCLCGGDLTDALRRRGWFLKRLRLCRSVEREMELSYHWWGWNYELFSREIWGRLHVICRIPALTHITSSILFCIRGTRNLELAVSALSWKHILYNIIIGVMDRIGRRERDTPMLCLGLWVTMNDAKSQPCSSKDESYIFLRVMVCFIWFYCCYNFQDKCQRKNVSGQDQMSLPSWEKLPCRSKTKAAYLEPYLVIITVGQEEVRRSKSEKNLCWEVVETRRWVILFMNLLINNEGLLFPWRSSTVSQKDCKILRIKYIRVVFFFVFFVPVWCQRWNHSLLMWKCSAIWDLNGSERDIPFIQLAFFSHLFPVSTAIWSNQHYPSHWLPGL